MWSSINKGLLLAELFFFCLNYLESNYILVTFAPKFQLQMGTKEKLRERFLKMPSDFTFDEMQRLLEGYGYKRSRFY